MKSLCLTLLLLIGLQAISLHTHDVAPQHELGKIHDVVIIGAGFAGIGASMALSKEGVEHLIIEGRDRIGGRVVTKELEGTPIHLGAAFIHSPQNNSIATILAQMNWGQEPTHYGSQEGYVEGRVGLLPKDMEEKAYAIFDELDEYMYKNIAGNASDISIADAASGFWDRLKTENYKVDYTVRWIYNMISSVEGAGHDKLSGKEYIDGRDFDTDEDYLPAGGYYKVIQAFYDINKPQIRLNQVVTKIDYSNEIIKIYTQNKVYQAKKVISSLPLGVMHKGSVEFQPELPETHKTALSKFGVGVFNKIFISFEEKFWDDSHHWIEFLTKEISWFTGAIIIKDAKFPTICIFIGGEQGLAASEKSDAEIIREFKKFLLKFKFTIKIKIRAYKITRWHQDPFSLTSYSYIKTGTVPHDAEIIRQPINDRLWMVGEHTHHRTHGCTHSAFETGQWAAAQVAASLKK